MPSPRNISSWHPVHLCRCLQHYARISLRRRKKQNTKQVLVLVWSGFNSANFGQKGEGSHLNTFDDISNKLIICPSGYTWAYTQPSFQSWEIIAGMLFWVGCQREVLGSDEQWKKRRWNQHQQTYESFGHLAFSWMFNHESCDASSICNDWERYIYIYIYIYSHRIHPCSPCSQPVVPSPIFFPAHAFSTSSSRCLTSNVWQVLHGCWDNSFEQGLIKSLAEMMHLGLLGCLKLL